MRGKRVYTPEVQTRICRLVTAGVPLMHACEAEGVSWNTCKGWLKHGREGIEPFTDFLAAWEQAKGAWVSGSVLRITKAADSDWKAAAWLLERRVERFQQRSRHEHSGPGGKAIEVAPPLPYREAMAELAKLAHEYPEVATVLEKASKGST